MACAQPIPRFRAEDVRPHGSAEPRPLLPGLLTWIFGTDLADSPGCTAKNASDPATYKTELCGSRVLVGGIEARLIAVMPGQINLVLPAQPWANQMVDVQVVRQGKASAVVPVHFGDNRPVLSLPEPAFAGMPVWVRVEKPWGKGWLRYPFDTAPWNTGPGVLEVRSQGRDLPMLSLLPFVLPNLGWMMSLPGEVPQKYLHRLPLHLVFPMDRPGTYEVRYTEYSPHWEVPLQSAWTPIEIHPPPPAPRRARRQRLAAAPPRDTVELLAHFLPSLLSQRDEPALRLLAPYLDSRDPLVSRYAAYALNYFDARLLEKVVPGRKPMRNVRI
jgi:hypothetical protein